MALSVLQMAHRRGLCVPQDLAVIGFDNMAESAYFWPALSTINHSLYELGCRAVQETVEQIESVRRDEKLEPQNILLSPELIVRESTVLR
jgi:LacI family transcriptional regulator